MEQQAGSGSADRPGRRDVPLHHRRGAADRAAAPDGRGPGRLTVASGHARHRVRRGGRRRLDPVDGAGQDASRAGACCRRSWPASSSAPRSRCSRARSRWCWRPGWRPPRPTRCSGRSWCRPRPSCSGPALRGRVVAIVFAGGNVALVLGVPAGTWLGERAGWRASFLAVAGLGALVLVVVASLLPSTRPDEGHAARGATPDARRFWLLVAVAVLTTAGAIAAYTYVALFVTEVSGFSASSVGAILLARGIASVLGILAFGALVDRSPWLALVTTVALQSVALLGLYALGHRPCRGRRPARPGRTGVRGVHRGARRPRAAGGARALRPRRRHASPPPSTSASPAAPWSPASRCRATACTARC